MKDENEEFGALVDRNGLSIAEVETDEEFRERVVSTFKSINSLPINCEEDYGWIPSIKVEVNDG